MRHATVIIGRDIKSDGRCMTTSIDDQKDTFRQLFDDCRAETEAILMGADPQQIIYADGGWRVKDIIAHVTAWEREVMTSIRAYSDGAAYTIADYTTDHAYNDLVFRRDYDLTFQQIQMEWAAVRAGLTAAIRAIPNERWDGQIMCPWHLASTIDGIVRDMINHETEHRHDIRSKVD